MDSTNATECIAVTAAKAGPFCGVSRSTWCDLHRRGLVPMPTRLGRKVLWLTDELRAWMAAGAPTRLRWEAMKRGAKL
jgi:predicted DNA-binding transcriptional regulator AlpA